jgi:hypothetical protein
VPDAPAHLLGDPRRGEEAERDHDRDEIRDRLQALKIDGMTWYQRKICSAADVAKSSVHALPIQTNALTGRTQDAISEPMNSATTSEHPETRSVQPQADIIQLKYVCPPPVS